MERTITAILTNSNDKKVFTSNANTLGELKAEMAIQGIDYAGMDFMEGLTHTTMMDDASILPSNIQYKGQTTNNLVFMLSTANKNIRSGADRAYLYDQIKKYNLQEVIKQKQKKNYTLCSNNVLQKYVDDALAATNVSAIPTDRKGIYKYIKENNLKDVINAEYGNYTRVNTATLVAACKKAACDKAAPCKKATPAKKETPKKKKVKSPYSNSELEEIVRRLRESI